jgi:hypothetical protein
MTWKETVRSTSSSSRGSVSSSATWASIRRSCAAYRPGCGRRPAPRGRRRPPGRRRHRPASAARSPRRNRRRGRRGAASPGPLGRQLVGHDVPLEPVGLVRDAGQRPLAGQLEAARSARSGRSPGRPARRSVGRAPEPTGAPTTGTKRQGRGHRRPRRPCPRRAPQANPVSRSRTAWLARASWSSSGRSSSACSEAVAWIAVSWPHRGTVVCRRRWPARSSGRGRRRRSASRMRSIRPASSRQAASSSLPSARRGRVGQRADQLVVLGDDGRGLRGAGTWSMLPRTLLLLVVGSDARSRATAPPQAAGARPEGPRARRTGPTI